MESNSERQWFIVGRWQEYAGEARAGLLRVVGICGFYGIQLFHYLTLDQRTAADLQFHQAASAVAAAWAFLSLGVFVCINRQYVPRSLKFISSIFDIILLTCLATIGGGPHSPLTQVFFVIIAMSALRFSLPLVWVTTLASMLGYLVLVGSADKTWFDSEHTVRPVEQLVTLFAMGIAGIVVGQIVRRGRYLAEEFERRMQAVRDS